MDIPHKGYSNTHMLENDSPAVMSAAWRWTCVFCYRSLMMYNGNVYGSAVEVECDNRGED